VRIAQKQGEPNEREMYWQLEKQRVLCRNSQKAIANFEMAAQVQLAHSFAFGRHIWINRGHHEHSTEHGLFHTRHIGSHQRTLHVILSTHHLCFARLFEAHHRRSVDVSMATTISIQFLTVYRIKKVL